MSRYEELNDLAWKERLGIGWRLIVVILCGFIFFSALFFFFMPDHVEEVAGTTISQHAVSDDQGIIRRYLIIRLDAGLTVSAAFTGDLLFQPGRRVVLVETKTKLFGYKRYKFNRFLEERVK